MLGERGRGREAAGSALRRCGIRSLPVSFPDLAHRIEFQVVPSARLARLTPAQVGRRFDRLLDAGAKLLPAGTARRNPRALLARRYPPRHLVQLFDATFYLTGPRQNDDIRFLVAYVSIDDGRKGPPRLHPRIFYKDISLTWRSASHWIRSENENWIGKGDVKVVVHDGQEYDESDEGTTDLPLEIQTALEEICRTVDRVPRDDDAVGLILRRAPPHRIAPYAEFTAPRRRAAENPANLIHGGRPFARFTRAGDPTSLRFAAGHAPDFEHGVVEVAHGTSRIYGGPLRRYRIVSQNRRVQYFFMAAPKQVWIASCQATSTELSTFGLRTVDAVVADELLLPGFEYHFVEPGSDPPVLYSQIPEGFAGEASPVDDSRVDTSAWLDAMPVIRDFRRQVLRAGRSRRRGKSPK